jgi:outer membrane protein assembly factor BamA
MSIEPAAHLAMGGGVEWQWPEIGAGLSPVWPSIETVFDPESAPGLDGASSYRRPNAFVAYDYREPRNPRRGGFYRVEASQVEDRSGGNYSFSRVDVDVRQYVGFLDGRRVFALRALGTTTSVVEGDEIPFYLLPSLGGNDTLRGFRALRFRGPHRILLQGEYRWDVWSGLEAALFADAGKVAQRRGDLNLRDLETNWGFGFRFNTDEGVVVRVDTALGSRDGPHLHIVFGGVF